MGKHSLASSPPPHHPAALAALNELLSGLTQLRLHMSQSSVEMGSHRAGLSPHPSGPSCSFLTLADSGMTSPKTRSPESCWRRTVPWRRHTRWAWHADVWATSSPHFSCRSERGNRFSLLHPSCPRQLAWSPRPSPHIKLSSGSQIKIVHRPGAPALCPSSSWS